MKKSTRALVGLGVIEALLLGGAAWMVVQVKSGAWQTEYPVGAIIEITETAGGVMGVGAVVLLLAWFVHRRNGN